MAYHHRKKMPIHLLAVGPTMGGLSLVLSCAKNMQASHLVNLSQSTKSLCRGVHQAHLDISTSNIRCHAPSPDAHHHVKGSTFPHCRSTSHRLPSRPDLNNAARRTQQCLHESTSARPGSP